MTLPGHLTVECREPEKRELITTRDIVNRMNDAESALKECSTRVKEIIRYDAEEQLSP